MVAATSSPSEEQLDRLGTMLTELAADAHERSRKCRFWAGLWQVNDLGLGVSAAVLAAAAGVTGLASTAGRIPAAIMALAAAALAAATRYLRSSERSERNRRRSNAWQLVDDDIRLILASEGHPGTQSLYENIEVIRGRRIALLEMIHEPFPKNVAEPVRSSGSVSPRPRSSS